MTILDEIKIYTTVYIWLKYLQKINNIHNFKISRRNSNEYDVYVYPVAPVKKIQVNLTINI